MSERNPTSAGANWVMWDVEVAKRYGGQWVVAVPNEVIASGDDAEAVRAEAAGKLGLPAPDLVVCWVATLESRVYG